MQIAVISNDHHVEEALRVTGFKVGRVELADLASLQRGAKSLAALVVDVRETHQLPPEVAAFSRLSQGTGVVLIAARLEPHLMLEAMRAGVNECIQEPVTPEALDAAVRGVIVQGAPVQAGKVIAFVGAKGGVGTTTLAVNTAAMLGKIADGDTLVIDLHMGFGDAALFVGAEPRFSVVDALENVHRVDESFFKSVVTKTKAGVDLLGSADRMVQAVADSQRVRALLDFAVRRYRFVVLDVPRSDASLDALEAVDTIVVVTSHELPSLRSAGRLAHTLRSRYGASHVKTVMNRFDKRAEISLADVERVIGDSVKHVIPSDYRPALEALNAGRPVALESGPLADAIRSLAGDLGGLKSRPDRPSGMLGRLAFRKA